MTEDLLSNWKFSTTSQPGNNREDWEKSVMMFRLPYWDWARKQTYNQKFALPEVLTMPQVYVWPPSGREIVMNPLWEFENPEKDASDEPLAFGQMPEHLKAWNIRFDYVDATIKDDDKRNAKKNIIPVSCFVSPDDALTNMVISGTSAQGLEGMEFSWTKNSRVTSELKGSTTSPVPTPNSKKYHGIHKRTSWITRP